MSLTLIRFSLGVSHVKMHATRWLPGAVLAVWFGIGGAAKADTLTFDDITNTGFATIPNGYGGLNWSNFDVLDGVAEIGGYNGYTNGTVSGDYVAYNAFGDPAEINISSADPIDFNSVYLTAAWNDGLSITVEGYQGATLAYTTTVQVDTDGPTLFNFNYLGVTGLRFISFGGTENPNSVGSGTQFAMDNFTFNEVVPEPASVVMVAVGGVLALGAGRIRRARSRA